MLRLAPLPPPPPNQCNQIFLFFFYFLTFLPYDFLQLPLLLTTFFIYIFFLNEIIMQLQGSEKNSIAKDICRRTK